MSLLSEHSTASQNCLSMVPASAYFASQPTLLHDIPAYAFGNTNGSRPRTVPLTNTDGSAIQLLINSSSYIVRTSRSDRRCNQQADEPYPKDIILICTCQTYDVFPLWCVGSLSTVLVRSVSQLLVHFQPQHTVAAASTYTMPWAALLLCATHHHNAAAVLSDSVLPVIPGVLIQRRHLCVYRPLARAEVLQMQLQQLPHICTPRVTMSASVGLAWLHSQLLDMHDSSRCSRHPLQHHEPAVCWILNQPNV